MQSKSQELMQFKRYCKYHPQMELSAICRSPFCGYYRELCEECCLQDQQHKEKFHIQLDIACSYVENRLKQIEKSFLILKKQKQEKSKINPITLPYQVKQKLSKIREIINEKITVFQKSLQQMYERQVNMKLQNLQQTLRKSLDFLKKQLTYFQKSQDLHYQLGRYFKNFDYWQHERKYYKSYMEEILQKQVKSFKEGFDDDNIMKMIVTFQKNLKSIFSSIKKNEKKQFIDRPHLFFEERKELKKYQIVERMSSQHFFIKPQFLGKPYPKENYRWQNAPQSIYYSDLDCFYIFGEGKIPSNVIVKYEDGKDSGNKKLSVVGQMFTKRAYFSTCLVNGQIFIVGGYNQKQGCLTKCQKMVVNTKVKMYLTSSLQQRSACHTVCNYKNKYIVKFGGTSIKLNQKQKYNIDKEVKDLYPQIYDIQKEQWRLIRYNLYNSNDRLQFGLWPLIVIPNQSEHNKIFVFGNKILQTQQDSAMHSSRSNNNKRKKFQIRCIFGRNEIEMKIVEGVFQMNKKYTMFPQTCHKIEKKGKFKVIAKDSSRSQNSLFLVDQVYEK